jgi:hypothetical protein
MHLHLISNAEAFIHSLIRRDTKYIETKARLFQARYLIRNTEMVNPLTRGWLMDHLKDSFLSLQGLQTGYTSILERGRGRV